MPRRKKKTGLPPGSLIFTGDRHVDKIDISYLEYNTEGYHETSLDNQSITSFHEPDESLNQWYDIRGVHDTELIGEIGKVFHVHPLVLEDVVDVFQRPKFDEYKNGVYISLRSLSYDHSSNSIMQEQVSIYFGNGFLLSFQEKDIDTFQAIRDRVRVGRPRIRESGTDYLAYAMIDMIVDHYFVVIEELEKKIDHLEEEITTDPKEHSKSRIHLLKQEILGARKAVGPLREAISRFARSDSPYIDSSTSIFVRDAYDHTIQLMDILETYRDIISGLQDLYISEISFRMNKVMQVLTLVTTIFVPLSFLAGLYGMNFEYMPELKYRYAYFVLLSAMAVIFVGTILIFKKKKWL